MRITLQDIQTTLGVQTTYDIVNAITNSSPSTFGPYVPLADKNNVLAVATGLQMEQGVMNEFITSLIDRIGLAVVKSVHLKNPLAKFKKGQMVLGRTIEEIFTDLTQSFKYDPYDAENTVFKRNVPNVKTLYHERNRQEYYKLTIGDDQIKTAFTSWGEFGSFVSSIYNSIYNSAEVDEYKYMKLLLDNYYAKGLYTMIPIANPVDQTSSSAFVKAVRATAMKMTLPMGTRDYNSLAVHTRADMNDLHLIMDASIIAEVDVDVLAKAFNMDKTSFMGNVTPIDGFASTGLVAVLVDKDFFAVYDNNLKLETIRNPQGLYYNIYYHVWQTLSTSRFSNAVAFVATGTATLPAVSQVIVSPAIASLKAGSTYAFNSYIRATDGASHPITWTVAGSTASTTLAPGTAIDSNGVLTVGATQTGELLVTATSTGTGIDTDGAGADTTNVVGQSIVTIV